MSDRYLFDSAQMTTLSQKFQNEAGSIQTLKGQLDSQVHSVIGSGYDGPAARRFGEAWNSNFRPALEQLNQALTEAATEIRNRLAAGQNAGA